jgi:hypothetical protein
MLAILILLIGSITIHALLSTKTTVEEVKSMLDSDEWF